MVEVDVGAGQQEHPLLRQTGQEGAMSGSMLIARLAVLGVDVVSDEESHPRILETRGGPGLHRSTFTPGLPPAAPGKPRQPPDCRSWYCRTVGTGCETDQPGHSR